MMHSLLPLLIALFSMSDPSASLTVKIQNVKGDLGEIEIGLYNDPAKFPEKGMHYKMKRVQAEDGTVLCIFEDLPVGQYAIALYHDENNDKVCNTNFWGIPTEGYAFSQNYRPFLSAPDFDDCMFSVKENSISTISLVY